MIEKNLDFEENQDKKKPDLPDNMRAYNEENTEIEEFTGFYPKFLPDKISKIEYILETERDLVCLVKINYYTTVIDLEKIKNEEKGQSQSQNQNEINIEKNEIYKEEEKDEDDVYENLRNKTFYRNKIDDDEEKILKKLITFYKQTRGTLKK